MLTDGVTPVSWSHCNMRVVPSTWHGSVRRSRGRPTRPSCELGARCGWPAEGKDPTTLRFSASVRQIVLEQRLGAIPDFCTWPYLRYFFFVRTSTNWQSRSASSMVASSSKCVRKKINFSTQMVWWCWLHFGAVSSHYRSEICSFLPMFMHRLFYRWCEGECMLN